MSDPVARLNAALEGRTPRKPLLSSATTTILLGVMAVLPAIPAPPSWPSLEPPYGIGWWVYVGSIVALSIWLFISHRQETRRREWEQNQRDDRAEERHQAGLINQQDQADRVIQHQKAGFQAVLGVNAQSGPSGKSLVSTIDDVGSLVARLYAERQHRQVAAISAGTTPLLEDISENPPKTEKEIKRAVGSLKEHIMLAEAGEYKIGGSDATPLVPRSEAPPDPKFGEERPET